MSRRSVSCTLAKTKAAIACTSGAGICSERAMSRITRSSSHWAMPGRVKESCECGVMIISMDAKMIERRAEIDYLEGNANRLPPG
jgi:hypothetical protein